VKALIARGGVRGFAATIVGVLLAASLSAQESQPLFKASVDVVTVDAWVHEQRRPVEGLTARDFIVRDNGVEQRVDAIGTTDSAHIIIGLDLSGSVDGPALMRLRAGVRSLIGQLTPTDRVSLFTFADRLRLLARAEVPGPRIEAGLATATAGGSTTLHDALIVGTALARADSRPAVFLLFTDGRDTASWATAARAVDAVRQSNVVVYAVGAGLPVAVISTPSTDYLRHHTWLVPRDGDTLRLLQTVADLTGGEFLRVDREDRLVATFSGILERYRQRYLLSFTPTGVKSGDGWHRLDVRLRGRPGAVVAREGYMAGPTPAVD
jgi:VWFA-related protein